MINSQIRASYWMTFPLTIVNFNHFFYTTGPSSPLWDTCNKTLKDKLQKFQNRTARITRASSYEIRSPDVLRALEWENLDSRRDMSKATLLYKILNDCSAPILKEALMRRNSLQTL